MGRLPSACPLFPMQQVLLSLIVCWLYPWGWEMGAFESLLCSEPAARSKAAFFEFFVHGCVFLFWGWGGVENVPRNLANNLIASLLLLLMLCVPLSGQMEAKKKKSGGGEADFSVGCPISSGFSKNNNNQVFSQPVFPWFHLCSEKLSFTFHLVAGRRKEKEYGIMARREGEGRDTYSHMGAWVRSLPRLRSQQLACANEACHLEIVSG